MLTIRHRRFAPPLLCALAACASSPPPATPAAAGERTDPAPTAPAPADPEIASLAPLRTLLMTGEDRAGLYYSLVTKASFAIEPDGRLKFLAAGEPLIDASTAGDGLSVDCEEFGAVANQRTTWFPYTGVFVRGGSLLEARTAAGVRKPLALSADAGGGMIHAGPDARATEYFYAPCVGAHRVATGWRLDDYLPADAALRLRSKDGRAIELQPPRPFVPFALLRYESGALVPLPMRIVLATVDLVEKRVVLQYQTTFATLPPLRRVELRLIAPDGAPGEQESAARYAERTQATLADLAACAPPREMAIEPCADATRRPDARIFFGAPDHALH
jgi:hypothetical protein